MYFKLTREIDRAAFEESAAWGQYYEPGNIDTLADCGYDREVVLQSIKAVDWSDDYWFPIPDSAEIGLFQFELRHAHFRTPGGRILDGYVCNEGHAIGLFGLRDCWTINQNLIEMFENERARILTDLGLQHDEELLPLQYEVGSLGAAKTFPTNQG